MSQAVDPIRVGMIGYGRAAVQHHVPEMEAQGGRFRAVAVCARNRNRQELAHARHECAVYGDFHDLLKNPDVELVDITTPSIDHAAMAIAALQAGKHVFLEKPIAVSLAEAEKLQSAARSAKGKLLVRHNRRFFADFTQMKEIIDSGRLGEVFLVRIRSLKYDLRDDWQTLKSHGGGILLNVGPHFIDHGLDLLGWKFQTLWAGTAVVAARGDAEDHAKILLQGEHGTVIDLEMSGGAALDEVSFSAYGRWGALVCDGKTIRMKYCDPGKITLHAARSATPDPKAPFGSGVAIPWVEETIPVGKPQREIWDEVYKTLREGAEFPITVEQAVLGLNVIDRAKRSAAQFDMRNI
jgi:scyllo-inositol 2-dehydrogenase (NADP+)